MSSYGNYVFILATNNTFKSFNETVYLIVKFSFKKDSPDDCIKKCFEKGDKNEINEIKDNGSSSIESDNKKKIIKVKKLYKYDINNEEISKKISKNPMLLKAYKELNYLITNITKKKIL